MPLVITSVWHEYLLLIPLLVVWIVLVRIFFSLWQLFVLYRFLVVLDWVLLEITVPKMVGVTPKATEQMLAGIHGAVKTPSLIEQYVEGFVQSRFSLEIVGSGGEVHFYIRTKKEFKDLVTSQVFAQYPDAEINEVEDYSKKIPEVIPNKQYDLWGTELEMTAETKSGVPNYVYPIRVHSHFKEDQTEEGMVDPLSGVIELFNHLPAGEHMWIQIIIESTHEKWPQESKKEVNALIGRKDEEKKSDIWAKGEKLLQQAAWEPRRLVGLDVPESENSEDQGLPSQMQFLSPGEKVAVEAIEDKASKLGFRSKIRMIYMGKREIFSRARVSALMGSWKPFSTQDLNGFKPDAKITSKINYFRREAREDKRKRLLRYRYQSRSMSGRDPFILNLEELATLFHFPSSYVQAPATPRVEAKKGVAPVNLPI